MKRDRVSVFAENGKSPKYQRGKHVSSISKGSTDDIGGEVLDMSLNSKFGSFKRVGGSVCIDPSSNV